MRLLKPHPWAKPEDGPVSRYLNRWGSAPISALLMRTNLPPNGVSLGIGLLAVPMLLLGARGHLALVGLLAQLASLLDGVDGELARLTGRTSRFGAVVDTLLDYALDAAAVLALGWALLVRGLAADLVLALVAATILIRHLSQFTVKTIPPEARRVRLCDTRDLFVFALWLGATAAEWTTPWVLVATLVLLNAWRLLVMGTRLLAFWRMEARALVPASAPEPEPEPTLEPAVRVEAGPKPEETSVLR